jgi:hypothetical protein
MSPFDAPLASHGAEISAQLRRWRVDRLAAAGFERPLALRVAADPRFDVHALVELTARGCPPELACRILAPLDSAW